MLPFEPGLCGSGVSNGGYVSGYISTVLTSTCGLNSHEDVEAGIYYGTSPWGSYSSGAVMHYYYIDGTQDILDLCSSSTADASGSGSGAYFPNGGDNVTISETAATSGNTYSVTWNDPAKSQGITISGLSTATRSMYYSTIQLETFNPTNIAVVYWGTPDYITSSYGYAHYSSSATHSMGTNYALDQPNSNYYNDWCIYYTGSGNWGSYC
jgi:hypothetical protein